MKLSPRILATTMLSLVAFCAGEALAGGIGFKNDLKSAIIVQGYTSVNGMKRFGPPILLKPEQVGWDNKLPVGVRTIAIYDANRPNLPPVYVEMVGFNGLDQFYSVRLVPPAPGKIKLVPDNPPVMPAK